jgi:hypothetical protein
MIMLVYTCLVLALPQRFGNPRIFVCLQANRQSINTNRIRPHERGIFQHPQKERKAQTDLLHES